MTKELRKLIADFYCNAKNVDNFFKDMYIEFGIGNLGTSECIDTLDQARTTKEGRELFSSGRDQLDNGLITIDYMAQEHGGMGDEMLSDLIDYHMPRLDDLGTHDKVVTDEFGKYVKPVISQAFAYNMDLALRAIGY